MPLPRTVSLTALLLGALLAGCTQDGPENAAPAPGQPDAVASGGPFLFEPARAVATVANRQHEAFLAVSADGQVLLTCAHGEFKEPANMFASTDGGATFRELLPPDPMLPAGDCEVAMSADGAWSFAGKTDVGIAVATTRDQGVTWIVNNLAGPPINGLADRQWLAYAGTTLLMTYQPGTQQAGPVLFTRSQDYGATWTQPIELAAMDAARPAIRIGDFTVASDGLRAYAMVSRELPLQGAASFWLYSTQDAGATWQATPADVPAAGDAGVLALTPDGALVWPYGDTAGDAGIAVVVSRDAGATWSAPVPLGAGVGWPRFWSSARPDGLVDVVWLTDGAQFGGTAGLALTRFDPATATVANAMVIAPIGFLEYASVAHDATGRAHVVVMDAPSTMQGELTTDLDGALLYVREAPAPG